MQSVVKKWFRDKDYGFIDNGSGPDIMVRKADLVNCQFLKVGSAVDFDCHVDGRGLIARNVRFKRQRDDGQSANGYRRGNSNPFGVMT